MKPCNRGILQALASLCFCLAMLMVFSLLTPAFAGNSAEMQGPGWPMKVIGWDIDMAYPDIPYEYRLGVQGGRYPYQFSLQSGPHGMEIHPYMGVITWQAPALSGVHDIAIDITDQDEQSIVHRFELRVSSDAFCFVAADGDDSNPGTESAPWVTLAHAVKTATNSRYIYVREGTYPTSLYIQNQACGKLMAYPGDQVTLRGVGKDHACIWLHSRGEYIFQGFHCDANGARWFFSVDSPWLSQLTIRKNHMFNIQDDELENPAFLFFWDGSQKPIQGEEHYTSILIQENTFHQLRNPHQHGASATLYDVQDLIFEDNIVYDIDGNGVTDKDDGFGNTYRKNLIYDCERGLVLANQNTQGMIDIHHNMIHDCQTALAIGWQPGYLRDVFVHHNTLLGSILFGSVLSHNADVRNINCHSNIIGNGQDFPYQFTPVPAADQYTYPSYIQDISDDTVLIDRNLLFVRSTQEIAGYEWGLPPMSLTDWRKAGFDATSLVETSPLDEAFLALPSFPPTAPEE